jgi:hypothetical protein
MAKRQNTLTNGKYNVTVNFESLGGGCCLILGGTTVTLNEDYASEAPEHDFISEVCELDSSAIRSAAYDKSTNTLKIVFQSGRVYTYDNVDHMTYINLISAESVGRYFNKYIRDHYKYRELKAA